MGGDLYRTTTSRSSFLGYFFRFLGTIYADSTLQIILICIFPRAPIVRTGSGETPEGEINSGSFSLGIYGAKAINVLFFRGLRKGG